MPRASPRKKSTVDYTETNDTDMKPATKGLAGKVVAKAKHAASAAAPKRKADPEPPAAQAPTAAKKRKTKAKDEGSAPAAERTAVSSLKKPMYIGAHISAAGGMCRVQNAITNAIRIGANSFALFMKSQRKWDNPPLSSEARDLFISNCKHHGYTAGEHALPHGSYLVNLAQADDAKAAQAYNSFLDDLQRCEQLGIKLYNFHPGNTGGEPRAAAIGRIAAQLNKAHKATKTVVTVLENMAGSGNVIGSTWEDLRDIIALVDDKERVGVCIDTCHAFAAGYDLRSPDSFQATIDSFNAIVGAKYLRAFHLNDSKAPLQSHRDLHANIGTGFLGLRAFHNVMNCDAFCNLPMVLETPTERKDANGKMAEDHTVWADEIKLLESLIGMDPETAEFKERETQLQAQGAGERSKIQSQVDEKAKKGAKKSQKKSK